MVDQSLKQWEAIGMSRASWYRHGKPSEKPDRRITQASIAKITGASLRTIQRDAANARQDERKANIKRVHEYMAQGYSQDEACHLRAAELRATAIEKLLIKEDGGLVTFAEASQYAATMAQSRDDPE